MTLFDLRGKKMYVGNQEIAKAYLGGNVFYSLRQSIEPYAYKETGMLYAYDFTQGSTEPYSTSNDVVAFKPVIFNSVTPVYTGTSMNLSAGLLRHQVTIAKATSFYVSVTFDTVSAKTGTLFYMVTTYDGHIRIEKQVSGKNITFMARYQYSGGSGESKVSPIITTQQTTLDLYIDSGRFAKFWVNGKPVGTFTQGYPELLSNTYASLYGAVDIYDYKMCLNPDYKLYLNPSSSPFTDAMVLEHYQNIQQRLQTI